MTTGPIGGNTYGTGPLKGTAKLDPKTLPTREAATKKTATRPLNQSSTLSLSKAPTNDRSLEELSAASTITALKGELSKLVPGIKFSEDRSKWSADELRSLKDLVGRMSPQDREKLAGTEFIKGDQARGEADVDKDKESGFATIRDNGTKAIYLFDSAYEGNSGGPQVSGGVLAHEVGHLMQTFSREDTLEFAKLGWVGPSGTKSFSEWRRNNDPDKPYEHLKPDPAGKPVSERGKANPQEDYAESYRLYTQDPQALLKASPERFLFLNGKSKAYSPEAVAKLSGEAGVNLKDVANRMANDFRLDLQQENIKGMLGASGLSLDKNAVTGSANQMLSNPNVSGLGKAIATISKEILAGNGAFEKTLLENPEKALASFWKDIAPTDRKLLSDRAYLKEMVADLKQGVATPETIKDELKDDLHLSGVKDFFALLFSKDATGQKLRGIMTDSKNMFDNNKLKVALQQAGVWDRLPPEMHKYLAEGTFVGSDNRMRMALILKSDAFQKAMSNPANVARFLDNVTVFNSLEFFDKLEGKKTRSGDSLKTIGGILTGANPFKNDHYVKEGEGVLNRIAAGEFGKGHGRGALPI